MDLPGDQMQKLGNLLSHFPGFLDQTTLPAKLDEASGRSSAGSANGELDYLTDIKPWLERAGVLRLPPTTAAGSEAAAERRRPLRDDERRDHLRSRRSRASRLTHEAYRGLQLAIVGERGRRLRHRRPAGAARRHRVRAGRPRRQGQRHGNGPERALPDGPERAAGRPARRRSTSTARSLEALHPDVRRAAAPEAGWPASRRPSRPGPSPAFAPRTMPSSSTPSRRRSPASTGGPSLLPLPAAHASVLAGLLPADTIFYVENQGHGRRAAEPLTQLRSVPELDAPLGMLDGLGGTGELVGWIQDAGIAVIEGRTRAERRGAARGPRRGCRDEPDREHSRPAGVRGSRRRGDRGHARRRSPGSP